MSTSFQDLCTQEPDEPELIRKTAGTAPVVSPGEIVDFRPEWERQMAREVEYDLGGEDEQYARELCDLLSKDDQDAARKIGETLYANGGHKRMVLICLRVKFLGGDAITLERMTWDGVGEWWG